MASAIAHAVLPIILLAAGDRPRSERRRLMVASAAVAVLPDLDLVTAMFEIRATDPLGHRGLSHSFVIAALVALFVSLMWFREWKRTWPILFAAAASHGVLDAFTTGEVGVALFAPISDARISSPWKLLPSCPVGLSEYLGAWGLFTLANELLYLLLPAGMLVAWRRGKPEERPRIARVAAIWAALAVLLRIAVPDYFAPTLPRLVRGIGENERDPSQMPHADLPEGKPVLRWDELEAHGTFGRPLEPSTAAWSSSFFPSWFGGEGGRWTEGRPKLVWRTLVGFDAPTEAEAKVWCTAAAAGDEAAKERIYTLAPTEKVDIALGRWDFPATRQALAISHNKPGMPRYWAGRCNGIAGAAMQHREPFRTVDVIAKDGTHVLFHPNDVKALLAIAYDGPEVELIFGEMCMDVTFDSGAACSMNPALFVLLLGNRIGIAKRSFLIDALPTIARQYYAVARARIDVVRAPYPANAEIVEPALRGKVRSFADVAIEIVASSTTVSYPKTDRRDDADPTGTRYRRVGLVPVVFHYTATIGLDEKGDLVGGRWTGDPADGPDDVVVVDGDPRLVGDGMLFAADQVPWSLVRDLARASADDGPATPTIDLSVRP